MAVKRDGIPVRAAGRMAAAALAAALALGAAPSRAQLTLSIDNRTCADLEVGLADAPGCALGVDPPSLLEKSRAAPGRGAPGVPGCFVEARKGFTAKLAVNRPYRPGYLRLSAQGECPGRNTKIAGECLVRLRTVYQRVPGPGFGVYRAPEAWSEGQSAGGQYGSPFYDLELSVPALPTLVTVEIQQGICELDAGVRRCEVFCRADDQQ
jgi:hypothetical protein